MIQTQADIHAVRDYGYATPDEFHRPIDGDRHTFSPICADGIRARILYRLGQKTDTSREPEEISAEENMRGENRWKQGKFLKFDEIKYYISNASGRNSYIDAGFDAPHCEEKCPANA